VILSLSLSLSLSPYLFLLSFQFLSFFPPSLSSLSFSLSFFLLCFRFIMFFSPSLSPLFLLSLSNLSLLFPCPPLSLPFSHFHIPYFYLSLLPSHKQFCSHYFLTLSFLSLSLVISFSIHSLSIHFSLSLSIHLPLSYLYPSLSLSLHLFLSISHSIHLPFSIDKLHNCNKYDTEVLSKYSSNSKMEQLIY
jgi:hypothetical protein